MPPECPHFAAWAVHKDLTFSAWAATKDPPFRKIYVSLKSVKLAWSLEIDLFR